VPLAEDSEQYDLEIRFGNAVVRVVSGLTSPSYVYTSADQATDFPGFVAQGLSNPGFETGDLSGWTVESGGTWTVDNAHESLNPRETAHVQVSVDFPASPTDHAIVAVYTTLDDASGSGTLSR
jgi:hypothetical protein